jgi:FlaA1/EpsC-like NDP-sugar epimerase
MIFENKTILITGGSGSWGNELTSQLLDKDPKKIIIFSRGEIAQVAMQRKFNDDRLQFVIGDVRDADAVDRIFQTGIDYVFHLAALKHVPICEYQPQEAIKTNIHGTVNMINAAIKYRIKKFTLVSTDKAVDPINTYGMTKGIAERLVIQANCMTNYTDFICIRGGNVLGTNGSLVPFLIEQIRTGKELYLTDPKMTRFFLTLKKAIELLFFAVEEGVGGEIYVMNMPSFYIKDLVEIIGNHYQYQGRIKDIGAREGEKLNESLISSLEISRTKYVNNNYFVIYPEIKTNRTHFHIWDSFEFQDTRYLESAFTSDQNLHTKEYLFDLLKQGGYLK